MRDSINCENCNNELSFEILPDDENKYQELICDRCLKSNFFTFDLSKTNEDFLNFLDNKT